MASARELRRQQREEEGAADEAEGAEEGPGPPRAGLSPSSSFRAQRAARGSTFSLWQDIPDVRGSGVLATLSLQDCKLQEVRPGRGGGREGAEVVPGAGETAGGAPGRGGGVRAQEVGPGAGSAGKGLGCGGTRTRTLDRDRRERGLGGRRGAEGETQGARGPSRS